MPPARRRGPARRSVPAVFPVFLALGVVGLLAALIAGTGGSGRTAGSGTTVAVPTTPTTTPGPPPEPVPAAALRAGDAPLPDAVPVSYRIEFELVENGRVSTELVTVRRPYEALSEISVDGMLTGGSATTLDALWTHVADQGGWVPVQGARHRAVADARPEAMVDVAVALGLAEVVGESTVAGRPCRGVVTAQPVAIGTMLAPSEDEVTELCVDDVGLVLSERWVRSGEVVRERTAQTVTIAPAVDETTFAPEPVAELTPELEAVLANAAPSAPSTEEELDGVGATVGVPDGYQLDAAVTRSDAASTAIVRYYSAGPDLLEVVEWLTTDDIDFAAGGFRPVTGAARSGIWFAPSLRAPAVRVGVDDRTFLEFSGTDPAMLLEMAEAIPTGS